MAYTTKYDYTLKFSPYLYNADGTTLKSTVSFKDTLEFKVDYQVKLNQTYWNEEVSTWLNPDGTPTYAKIEDVPLPQNTEYLFRASFSAVTNPATDGYTVESNGYKVSQPSNGTFVVTVDESASGTPTLYIYLVDPHREIFGTDAAFNLVNRTVDKYVGSYDAETKARKVTKVEETIQVQVPKTPNELDTLVTVTGGNSFAVSGALLPEYTPNIVTYEDVDISDDELVMTLAEGFTTDEVEVTTYPFSLNLVPEKVEETVAQVTTVTYTYKSDLHGVRPGIYQVYATYQGARYRLRDLVIKGYNVLSPSKKLDSETVTEDETTTITYSYNANVGESMILTLYSNPVSDSKDTRLVLSSNYSNQEVTLKMIPNAAGCNATAVVNINAFVADSVEVTAINQLVPNDGNVTDVATRLIKVIPEAQAKTYTIPEEFPADSNIKLFDEIVDIFRYAGGRKVFTTTISGLNLYCITTNEGDETATEYEFEYAMTIADFVKKPSGE